MYVQHEGISINQNENVYHNNAITQNTFHLLLVLLSSSSSSSLLLSSNFKGNVHCAAAAIVADIDIKNK